MRSWETEGGSTGHGSEQEGGLQASTRHASEFVGFEEERNEQAKQGLHIELTGVQVADANIAELFEVVEIAHEERRGRKSRNYDRADPLAANDAADKRKLLLSSTKAGNVDELKKFMFSCSNESEHFQHSVLLHSTYDDHGSTLLQIAVENGHSEIVELLLSHKQFTLGDPEDLRQGRTPRWEVVSTAILLVYYLNALSHSILFRLCQSYPDSTLREYVRASGIEAQDDLQLVAQASTSSIDVPFLQRLMSFMRDQALTFHDDDDVRIFLGDSLLQASYDELQDARHIVLLYAFASRSTHARDILKTLEAEFKGAYSLFNRVFSCRDTESASSSSKDMKFLLGRLVGALKFEMIHARSQFKFDTALHMATLTHNVEMADILLKHYDDLADYDDGTCHFLDVYSMTPLHYAVMLKSEKLIKTLLYNASYVKHVNARDWCLRTPLHLACACGGYVDSAFITSSSEIQLKVVKLLVSEDCKNVDLNAKDCCGFTPLHWAVHVRALEVVRFLLHFKDGSGDRTIRTTEKDADEKTLIQHAMENDIPVANAANYDSTSASKKKEIERLLMSQPGVKDEIDIMYRDRQVYVDAANAILVGAALIASVTYGGWLQPPSGTDDESTHTRMRIFWAFNSMSFFSAIATVMAGAGAVLPISNLYIETAVQRVRDWLALTSFLLVISVTFVLGAFAAAGFASVSKFPYLGSNMVVTTVLGFIECLPIGLLFLRGLSKVNSEWQWFSGMRQQLSAVFQNKVQDSVKSAMKNVDLKGGNGHVWHRHFALFISQRLFPFDLDKKLVARLDRQQQYTLIQCWTVLIDDFESRKFGYRPVLPPCAYDQRVVGDRGVQHAIMDLSSTNSCRQICIARDSFLLRDLRSNQKIDAERLFKAFRDVLQQCVL